MPPEVSRDAIVIAFDIGKSVSELNYWEEKTFFEQSRDCISWIIQRKLTSDSQDLLSLILIGSEASDNAVTASGYNNISCKFDFQVASWDMLNFIKDEVRSTKQNSDWIGGLVVAMEMLREYEKLDDIKNKKIVFFSDFTHPAPDNLDVIAKNIKSLHIDITIIGPTYISDLANEDELQSPPEKRLRIENDARHGRSMGEKLVSQLWSKLPENVGICSFETALKQLCAYIRKPTRKTPWNCILDIGEVKINISMFKKTDPKAPKKFNTKCLRQSNEINANAQSSQCSLNPTPDDVAAIVRDKVMSYKHDTGQSSSFVDVQVEPDETIEGYRYGRTVIPFGEEDKKIMQFKSGPKCFSVIGFTNISSVPYYLLSGERSYFVISRDKDENAEVALSGVIQAMKELEVLAIVRRVYSSDTSLSLGVLYPVIEEISGEDLDEVFYKEYLLFVELAFEEEIKSINFPSLEPIAKKLTEKQVEAIDNLIEGMDLMKADKGLRGEPCEAFEISKLYDFKEQFFKHCEILRGLYPEKPLPTSLPPSIEDFVKVPVAIESKMKFLVKEIKEQFKTEITKKKSPGKEIVTVNKDDENEEKDDEEGLNSACSSLRELEEEECRNEDEPVENDSLVITHFEESVIQKENNSVKRDLMKLFDNKFPSDDDLDKFMEGLSDKEEGNDNSNVLLCFQEVITAVRNKYLKINPDLYNWWMLKFKGYVHTKTGIELEMWDIIATRKLGLITEKENKYSRVTDEEAEDFIYNEVTPSFPFRSPKVKRPDFGTQSDFSDLTSEQMEMGSLF